MAASIWALSENKDWDYLRYEFDWVKRMDGIQQDKKYHAEGDVAIHTQMVLHELINHIEYKKLSEQEQEILWAAALLHDVEKYSTTVFEEDGSITSKGHAKKGALTARQILYRDINTPFKIREQIVALVRYHGLPIWIHDKEDAVKSLIKASLEVNTKLLSLLARADMLGRICDDQEDMLFNIDYFDDLCRQYNCWDNEFTFETEETKMHFFLKENADLYYIPYNNPEFEVILMSGLPGAGKDTFIKKNYPNYPIVSIDDIRLANKVKPTDKTGNGQAIQEAKETAKIYLRKKQNFVWNATNVTKQMREQLIDLFITYKARVNLVYIEVPYSKLSNQNKSREAIVPSKVIEKLIDKLEVPRKWEAHNLNYIVYE